MPCLDRGNAPATPPSNRNAVAIDAGRITADNERAVRLNLLSPRLRHDLGAKEAIKAGAQEGLIGVDGGILPESARPIPAAWLCASLFVRRRGCAVRRIVFPRRPF